MMPILKKEAVNGVGGCIEKDQVLGAVHEYENYHSYYGGGDEARKSNYTDMVNKFYDLVTSFYEKGWGTSFHFAPGWKEETVRESLKRHEHYLASQLQLQPGHKVLDVGCGVGGPLREIARFSSVSITGVNNNDYQINRGTELNNIAGVEKTCGFVKADFMNMPFPDNCFDAVYAIDATCHAPDAVGCYKEIHRVLKPGQYFGVYEWCMTDAFDPNNQDHQKIKADIELGNGLPDIRSTTQCCQAVQQAGFQIISAQDLDVGSEVPWYSPLQPRLAAFRVFLITVQLMVLEALGVAPKGSRRVYAFLHKALDGLHNGGRKGIFTPVFFILARKPLSQ